MPLEASRALFLMLIKDKLKAIFNVANFIGLFLGKTETFETGV